MNLLIDRMFHFFDRSSRIDRVQKICMAMDSAIEKFGGVKSLKGRNATIDDARKAVKLSHYHCGPVAREAEKSLHEQGVLGVEFHSLSWHYVIRDQYTGLFHDLESPGGQSRCEDLPICHRAMEMSSDEKGFESGSWDRIFEDYAKRWLVNRLDRDFKKL